jgi:methylase of polypeptide subunit release factors|tara:strand:+ start:91 stop:750 length:660 start_codon:yes stop_codon:yes gene_type:complete
MNLKDFDPLEGGGIWLRYYFEQYFAKYNLKYKKGAELCAGKGTIGFYLLENGYFETMDFIEVNPDAIAVLHETIKQKGLEEKCNVYMSDCLTNPDIPKDYDCIISNPPWYSSEVYFHSDRENVFLPDGENLDKRTTPPLLYMDRDWELHKRIFSTISNYTKVLTLVEGAMASAPVTFEPMLSDNQTIERVFNDDHNIPERILSKWKIPHYSYIFSIINS